ncbi:MAG: PaaI family thioesterase [Deltaproteobacteria bacterium]|nr:MAG: PaaI family thioesterase [Deltaproteobacteria bacterium]
MQKDDNEKKRRLDFLKELVNSSPYYQHLGMEVTESLDGSSRMRMEIRREHTNIYGTVHGGVICSMADSTCGLALGSLLNEGETAVTLDLRINYFAPLREGEVTGIGKVIHKGGKTAVEEAEIMDKDGKLVAKAIVTHFIIKPAENP